MLVPAIVERIDSSKSAYTRALTSVTTKNPSDLDADCRGWGFYSFAQAVQENSSIVLL
jgi:hypothetical protein